MTTTTSYVLYVDYQDHPAPLTECFQSTGARRLSSIVHRSPPCTLSQVDSAFCPQCLSFHDVATAARMGYCTRPQCKMCPVCQSICGVEATDGSCFYKCSGCEWTSKECNMVQSIAMEDDKSVGKVEFARALEDLGKQWEKERQVRQTMIDLHFQKVADAWEKRAKSDRQPGGSLRTSHGKSTEAWSLRSLEESLIEKKKIASDVAPLTLEGLDVERITPQQSSNFVDSSIQSISTLSYDFQATNAASQVISRSDLLPLPIPFRVRKSLRCRAEIAEGRPGILLKPKLNPLEGDSSLRTGQGQWWKKDSSAIHVVPNLQVTRSIESDGCSFFLLKAINPTLGPVRMRFAASRYGGEPSWDNAQVLTARLSALLVDSLTDERMDVELDTNVLANLSTTNSVELQSAEDSFIELGDKSRAIPSEVRSWNPGASSSKREASIRIISHGASTAWFELTVPTTSESSSRTIGVPLSLQVEIGNGSWETSLVQAQTTEEQDFANFDIIIVWKSM